MIFLTAFHMTGIDKLLYLILYVASLFRTQEFLEQGHKLESLNLLKGSASLPKIKGIIIHSLYGEQEKEAKV